MATTTICARIFMSAHSSLCADIGQFVWIVCCPDCVLSTHVLLHVTGFGNRIRPFGN